MLGITTSQPVHWPPSASPAVASVTPVGAVTPAQGMLRDPSSSGFGSGRDGQSGVTPDAAQDRRASSDKGSPETKAAPILPGEKQEGGRAGASSGLADTAQTQELDKQAKAQAEERAAQQLQLQEVLSTVWKASAAVVDVVLGRDAGGAAGSANPATEANKVASATQAASGPLTIGPSAQAVQRLPSDPVTYSDQGAGVWEAVETGTRLNKKA